jgi:hypothetical protein
VLPPEDVEIVVIDADDSHVYQPGLLFVPFGLATPGVWCVPDPASSAPVSSFGAVP